MLTRSKTAVCSIFYSTVTLICDTFIPKCDTCISTMKQFLLVQTKNDHRIHILANNLATLMLIESKNVAKWRCNHSCCIRTSDKLNHAFFLHQRRHCPGLTNQLLTSAMPCNTFQHYTHVRQQLKWIRKVNTEKSRKIYTDSYKQK